VGVAGAEVAAGVVAVAEVERQGHSLWRTAGLKHADPWRDRP
jgi:hypothetical protein